jgi:hypothetical protein
MMIHHGNPAPHQTSETSVNGFKWIMNTDRKTAWSMIQRKLHLRIGDPRAGKWTVPMLQGVGLVGVYEPSSATAKAPAVEADRPQA